MGKWFHKPKWLVPKFHPRSSRPLKHDAILLEHSSGPFLCGEAHKSSEPRPGSWQLELATQSASTGSTLRWRGLLRVVGYLFRGLQIVFGRWHDLSISRIYHKLYNARFHYPSFRGFFQTLRFHSRTWFRLLYLSLVIHVLESFCSQADQHVGWAEHVQTPFASNSQLNVTKVCEMRSALLAICTPFPSALNGKEWALVFCGASRCLLHSPTSGSFGGGWLSSPQELSMSDCHIWTRGCKRITSSFVKTVSLF